MSIYTEFELRCDCRFPDDKFGCEPAIYASTKERALADAKSAGWSTRRADGRVYHYQPGHEPSRGVRS